MNAITITPAALHAALAEVEAIGRVQGTAAYAGGIAALRGLFQPDAPQQPMISALSRDMLTNAEFLAEVAGAHGRRAPTPEPTSHECIAAAAPRHEACSMCGGAIDFWAPHVITSNHMPFCLPCWNRSLPSADPPIDIPPLPAGPEDVAASAPTEAPPAAEAAERTFAPAPAPPPALAPEGISPSPEAGHAPPGDASAPSEAPEKPQPPRADGGFRGMTEEQKAALREMWPNRTISGRAIRERLTEMGGCAVNNDSRLYQLAKHLDLPRRTLLWVEQDLAREVTRPPSLSADDMAEGDRNIRAGWSPLQLVEWFGITEAEAQAWRASLRAAEALATPAPESVVVAAADAAPGSEPGADDATADTPEAAAPAPTEAIAAPVALSFPEDPQGREVWEAFDSGMSVRDVGADFGIPLSTLTNTHAQWTLARRKELAS